jgi:phenylalanyl-tRNA synthetase beta chain
MKFSESWLREWINPDLNREQLLNQLTMLGLEVDVAEPVSGQFSKVKVGEVIACEPHPDADKLSVTRVDVGDEALLDIVCGAKNCRQGIKVAVATVGAVLPGDFKIKKTKLRGQPSHGMLCAYQELGIDIESDGILELPADAPIGQDFFEYFKLDDVAVDIDLTPNRADCLSIQGLAREIGATQQQSPQEPVIPAIKAQINDSKQIVIEAPQACPKYLSRIIKNVQVDAITPWWLQEKLRRSGIRSVDPIVDVTNFVLLELGQPMHAFDLKHIEGDIHVRMAKHGERLVLLDGKEVELNETTLVIADEEKSLAMAGIFGGLASSVQTSTQDIVLECAYFAPEAIAGKAREYGLHTDSSHRFERGVDPQLQSKAMARATQLIQEICGGQVGPVVEAIDDNNMPHSKTISLRFEQVSRRLGVTIPADKVKSIFEALGFGVKSSDTCWDITVPSYRFDMNIEADLIEEVGRLYGYSNIEPAQPTVSLKMRQHKEGQLPLRKIRQTMISRGFNEAITYSFVDPKKQKLFHPNIAPLTLPNPISQDMSVMRLSLITGLLTTVSYNQKRQQNRLRLFEVGLRFVPHTEADMGVDQQLMLTAVITGTQQIEQWNADTKPVDFFDLKSDLEALFELTGDESSFELQQAQHEGFHPGQCADIFRNGKYIGMIGTIHPSLKKTLGLNGRAVVFEVDLKNLLGLKVPAYKNISKFPANRRDIAIVVKQDVNANNILNLIKKVGGNQIVGLSLFDIYQGPSIASGHKSLAISMIIQNNDRTLEELEITEIVTQVVSALKSEFNALLRD